MAAGPGAGGAGSGSGGSAGSGVSGAGWRGQQAPGDPSLSVGKEAAADRKSEDSVASVPSASSWLTEGPPNEEPPGDGQLTGGMESVQLVDSVWDYVGPLIEPPPKGRKSSRPRGQGGWSCRHRHNERCWSLHQLLSAGRPHLPHLPRLLGRPWSPKPLTSSHQSQAAPNPPAGRERTRGTERDAAGHAKGWPSGRRGQRQGSRQPRG